MKFVCTPLEMYNKERTAVVGYGVEWNEPRQFREGLLRFIATTVFVVAAFAAYCAMYIGLKLGSQFFVPLAMVAAACIALGVYLLRVAVRDRGKLQSLEFYKDGRINSSWEGLWKIEVSDIRAVEQEQLRSPTQSELQHHTHGVRLITRRGRVLHVARNIEPDDAICLAVTMNEALEAVRYVDQRHQPARMNGVAAEVW